MSDCQEFPNTWEEFEQWYGFEDKKEIYTNGSRLIQSFRVKQWLDHTAEPERKKGKWIKIGHWGRSYKCNQCGNTLDFDGVNVGRGDANFCPNCGAEMRGE